MKVFTTVCTMVALASAESQLLIAQNNVNYYRRPNVGQTYYNGYVDYVDLGLPVMSQPHLYGYPNMVMRFKREAEPEATHAKAYKSKVSDPNGGYYEYEVQVNRDGEGQSFQHHEQKQQRIEEQLYHNMMNARNNNNFDRQFERYQDVMMDQNRFDQQQQQQYQMNRQNQMINQLINMNQRNTFGRFFEQQRPLYSHRLINSKNNQQRQQYIREKLNNFGQRKSDDRRMFKREADPSLMTYTVATSHPMMSFDNYRNTIYSNNMDNLRRMSYLRQFPVAYRQATINGESMKEFHPEGTMSMRNLYNSDIYRFGRNFGYETMVDL